MKDNNVLKKMSFVAIGMEPLSELLRDMWGHVVEHIPKSEWRQPGPQASPSLF